MSQSCRMTIGGPDSSLASVTNSRPSIDDYVADKSTVLQRVLHRAGLDPAELGIIDDVNRVSGQPR